MLTVSSSGTPYIVYQDLYYNHHATVMKYSDSGWIDVGSPGFSLNVAYTPTIAVAANGIPYVAFLSGSLNGSATVMKYNDSEWVFVGDSLTAATATSYLTSIAIDNNGTPYLAYGSVDGTGGIKITVIKYVDSAWDTVGEPVFSLGHDADEFSMTIDKNGIPYVVYEQIDSGQTDGGGITVMKYSGSNWTVVGNPQFSTGDAQWPSIAIGNNGTPYVAFENSPINAHGKATVMKYDGANWVPVGEGAISSGGATCTSIAIDSSGTPYVAYSDTVNNYKATVKKYVDSAWVTVGSADFSPVNASYESLAIDPSGTPYVAFTNGVGGTLSVMKYISDTTTGINNIPENSFTIYPNPSSGKFNISSSGKLFSVKLFDITGKLCLFQPVQNGNSTVDASNLANGIYTVMLLSNEAVVEKKLLIAR